VKSTPRAVCVLGVVRLKRLHQRAGGEENNIVAVWFLRLQMPNPCLSLLESRDPIARLDKTEFHPVPSTRWFFIDLETPPIGEFQPCSNFPSLELCRLTVTHRPDSKPNAASNGRRATVPLVVPAQLEMVNRKARIEEPLLERPAVAGSRPVKSQASSEAAVGPYHDMYDSTPNGGGPAATTRARDPNRLQ